MKVILSAFLIVVFFCIGFTSGPVRKRSMPRNSTELGKMLFFDPILSKDQSVSCASCHKPEFAFADNRPLSLGVGDSPTVRNTPSILYLELSSIIFWDGRAQTVMHQAFFPITHPNEMGMTKEGAIERLNKDKFYVQAFEKIFRSKPDIVNISRALADFQQSLNYYNAPYDRFYLGDDSAISQAAIDGLIVFHDKGNCLACHRVGKGTHDQTAIKNIGLYNGKEYNDPGRFAITGDSADLGKFKVPVLRNLSLTGPYMHNGAFKTLREVIEFYNKPSKFVQGSINMDPEMKDSLGLTEKEIDDLEAFLLTLDDDNIQEKLAAFKDMEQQTVLSKNNNKNGKNK